MRRLPRSLALLVTIPLLATACGGGASAGKVSTPPDSGSGVTAMQGADGVQQVTIDTTDSFRFVPSAIKAHVGKVRITLTNKGSYPHNISVPSLHATSSTVSGNPGQQQTNFTVTFAHPGTYEFVCTFHSSAGMKGRITIS